MASFAIVLLTSAVAGVEVHHQCFMRGEHDFWTVNYLQHLGLVIFFGPILLHIAIGVELAVAYAGTLASCMAFLGGLLVSMLVYRLFFHRLKKFPGPTTWASSKLFQCWCNTDLKAYRHIHALHQKHGDFVRTGPTELSITHGDAPQVVLGSLSKCTKALWYDMSRPQKTMHLCRDKQAHDFRRRIWVKGFSAKAMRAYEPIVLRYTKSLMNQMGQMSDQPLNVTKWMHFYSFDIMGDVAFGESFGMLESRETHFAIKYLFDFMRPMGIWTPVPWLFEIVKRIPGETSRSAARFVAWCSARVDSRAKLDTGRQDIMSWLLEAPSMTNDPSEDYAWLTGDARLIVIAGSDTVAASLSFAFFELLKNPSYIKELRAELDPLRQHAGEFESAALTTEAPLLNAIISETLRMHPALASGVLRQTPSEGISIGGIFIPGNIAVSIPFYSLQRSPRSFAKPDEFIPERWTSQPELIHHAEAYAPFSVGKFGCIGKPLALMEMRAVLANLVCEFDMEFAPREDGSNLIDKLEDHFTISPGDMFVAFRKRTR